VKARLVGLLADQHERIRKFVSRKAMASLGA
jgi:hypothetical protein